MSDLGLALAFAALVFAALRQPWIGAVASLWVSVMSPHIEFGWRTATWPIAMVLALATMLGLLLTRDRQSPFVGAPVWFLLAFWVWCLVGYPFSIHVADSTAMVEKVTKIYILIFLTLMLINTQRKLEWLVLAMVVSLGFYGVKGGLFTILTGGNYRVWGPGGFVEGNNELALALIALMPLVQYLQMRNENKWVKRAALGTLLLLPVCVLGSHSRGGLVGLAAMALFLWWRSDKKVVRGGIMLAVGAAAAAVMPAQWWDRMQTIEHYEADSSALGRLNAWSTMLNVAKNHVFGGGFQIYTPEVFWRYAPEPERIHAAHSIYFQVLGEHGFIGLILFLGIGATTWFTCSRLIRAGKRDPALRWASQLGSMLQVSMVGIAVAGAFLSLAYFDLLYYEMVMAVVAGKLVREHQRAAAKATAGLHAAEGGQPVRLSTGMPPPARPTWP